MPSLMSYHRRLSGHYRRRMRQIAPGYAGRGPVVVRGLPRCKESETWVNGVVARLRLEMLLEGPSDAETTA